MISIIICTRGRSFELGETLASLSRVQAPPQLVAELIVVENGSKGEAEALTACFQHKGIIAHYFYEPIPGKSNALNRAVAESIGEILLFTDDDIRFPRDWVERVCEPLRSGRADAVAGGVTIARHLLRPWMTHTHRAWLASTADYLSSESPSEMCGANMALTRRAFEQVGCFDPELGPGVTAGGEESLVSWQLKLAGFRIVGALDVQVEHHFDPRRLRYANWLNSARLKGRARAYLMHHWFHQRISFPLIWQRYLQAKLIIRRACSKRRNADDEGIYPWELSYEQDIATCAHYARERCRPMRYRRRELLSSPSDRRTVPL